MTGKKINDGGNKRKEEEENIQIKKTSRLWTRR